LRAGGPRFKSGRPDHIYGTVKVFEQPAGLPSGIHRVSLGSEGRSTYVVLTAPDWRSAARGLGVCVKRETANGQRLDHALVQRLI
jgi:hypothetical protein